jgi:hypothetical protein
MTRALETALADVAETKWTPGPWEIVPHDRYDKDILIVPSSVWVDNDDVDHEESKANASLIATAPDLYEALTYAMHLIRESPGANETYRAAAERKARAALAKARGES